jgi:integrase
MAENINTATARAALPPRREPYWAAPVERGRSVGYRKIDKDRGTWIARARDPETGKQQYHALKQVPDGDFYAARAAAVAWFKSLDQGVTHKGPFTVADAAREYVEELRRGGRSEAADDAEWRFRRCEIYGMDTDAEESGEPRAKLAKLRVGRIEVTRLRSPTLKAWRDALSVGPSAQNRMMAVLRAALNLAVTNNRVPASAAQAWHSVKQHAKADGRREVFLDLAQRRALLGAAQGNVKDLISAALLIGARPGELVAVTRAAFDHRTKLVRLSGKTGPRDVPLAGAALSLFERLAKSKLPAALLFTRDDGEPWTRIEWSRAIRAAADAAVVKDERGKSQKLPPGVVLYSLRHAAITEMLLGGMSTLSVAKLTGTSLAMIEQSYGKYVQDTVREQLEKVQML